MAVWHCSVVDWSFDDADGGKVTSLRVVAAPSNDI